MVIGINPLVDFAAKRLLGSPEHSAITLHFLNAVLQYEDPIVDVTILNPISLKDYDADKLSVLGYQGDRRPRPAVQYRGADQPPAQPAGTADLLRGPPTGRAAERGRRLRPA